MALINLCFTSLLSAAEVTVTSSALPTIVYTLDANNNHSWVITPTSCPDMHYHTNSPNS